MTGWVKPCSTGTCVDVAASEAIDGVVIRCEPTSPGRVLHVSAAEWWQFRDDVKAGKFDDVHPRRKP